MISLTCTRCSGIKFHFTFYKCNISGSFVWIILYLFLSKKSFDLFIRQYYVDQHINYSEHFDVDVNACSSYVFSQLGTAVD